MSRVCSVCQHPERESIDRALINGASVRDLAGRYTPPLSKTAIQRHKESHLPETLTKAREAAEASHGDDLLKQVRVLQHQTLRILQAAVITQDLRVALAAIGQARGNVELMAKLHETRELEARLEALERRDDVGDVS